MPILRFQCPSCGLSFKKRVSRSAEESECRSCGGPSFIEGSVKLSVGFGSDVSGLKAQDTGMESLDLDYDRVVGEDARQKWDMIYQRRRDKWALINQNKGSTGRDILRADDGSYLIHRHAGSVLEKNRNLAMDTIKSKTSNLSQER